MEFEVTGDSSSDENGVSLYARYKTENVNYEGDVWTFGRNVKDALKKMEDGKKKINFDSIIKQKEADLKIFNNLKSKHGW